MSYAINCGKHKSRGLQQPRTACLECWMQYLQQNPDKPVTARMLLKVTQGLLMKLGM